MKFRVLVGEEFPCYVAEDAPSSVVINVAQAAPTVNVEKRSGRILPGVIVFAAICSMAILPAAFYGVATGDYSSLRDTVEIVGDLLKATANFLK